MSDAPFAVDGPAEIIAHRGFSAQAPENTLVALRHAVEAGADAVEFDLHVAGCGTPVLLHDATLDRTTSGSGPVTAIPAEALATLDAGSWFGADFAGEPVPRFADALAFLTGRVRRIYAEIKGYRALADVDRLVAEVQAAGLAETVVFISMDWDALRRTRDSDATSRIGYIVEKRERADQALEAATGDEHALLDYDARILLTAPGLTRRAHDAEVPLATWTVNRAIAARRLLALGVPRITTNEVDDLIAWKRSL